MVVTLLDNKVLGTFENYAEAFEHACDNVECVAAVVFQFCPTGGQHYAMPSLRQEA